MDGPQGPPPHQPSSTNWMYMQHLLQQLQDHQQPQQQQQQQQQPQHHQPPPPQHQHIHPHHHHHQQQQHLTAPPQPQQQQQHHVPLQHLPAAAAPQQYIQHHNPQQRYKHAAPPPQQQQKPYIRSEDHSYSVESILGVGPRADMSQPPLQHPQHPPGPIPPKVQPDNEMMVMSFLNELEGGKKMQHNNVNVPPPAPLPKPTSTSGTEGFVPQDLDRDMMAQQQQQQQIGHAPPLSLPTDDPQRLNHNGESVVVSRPPNAPLLPDAMGLNAVYEEGGGGAAAMNQLERGDSASSMSQLDLGLSDDSNPLIDQLESALESDSSLQAKTDDCPAPDAQQQQQQQPQTTEILMSLLSPSDKDAAQDPGTIAPPGDHEEDQEGEDAGTPQIAITEVASLSANHSTNADTQEIEGEADTQDATPPKSPEGDAKDPPASPPSKDAPPPPPPEGIDESSDVELQGETIREEADQTTSVDPPGTKGSLRIKVNCLEKTVESVPPQTTQTAPRPSSYKT